MRKNVTGRTVVIVVTILICVFGIIGFPKSRADLMAVSYTHLDVYKRQALSMVPV